MGSGEKCAEQYRGLGIKAKKFLYEGVIVPTALYGAETCGYEKCCEKENECS